jgi:hypothetical protein
VPGTGAGHRTSRYAGAVAGRRQLSSRGARKLGERERAVGLDPDDEAAQWLAEHDPEPPAEPSKSSRKSKRLHQFRQRSS